MANCFNLPNLGLGIGLRSPHFAHILNEQPAVDWFEVISENFMDTAGQPLKVLDQIAERYPVVMHGVSLSIGSSEPLDFDYLKKLKTLAERISPHWISDHLCWTGIAGLNTHDLLPMPLNEEALDHVVDRIRKVQDFLERPLVLENPSTYLEFQDSSINDWEFLGEMAERADCGILLDINNIYVCSRNHNWNPLEYIASIPPERIIQFHLAGHEDNGTHVIDTHDSAVIDAVWELYRYAHNHTGGDGASTLLEWDASIPPFKDLLKEVTKAKNFMGGSGPNIELIKNSLRESPETPHPKAVHHHPLHIIPAK